MNPTNDPSLTSWVKSAQGSDFPIQNLPWGIFSTEGDERRRAGVRIGDRVLDVDALQEAGLLDAALPRRIFATGTLDAFIGLGRPIWSSTRARLSELLHEEVAILRDDPVLRTRALVPIEAAVTHLPVSVGGYTDFYSSREHATNVGRMFRPDDEPLLPNWLAIPIGYNGRASTVVVSGTPVRRPLGQMKAPNAPAPSFGPCRKLDFELEMAAVIGVANPMGSVMTVAEADRAIFGWALFDDWSARDIQAWEYVPLGPFQAKVFASSIGAWIVTAEALEPFRVDGPAQDPAPLPYLVQPGAMNLDVELEVAIRPKGASEPTVITRTNFAHMYWSTAQQLAHHAIGGCAMNIGDIIGSGTISGPTPDSLGSLLELTWNGTRPLTLADGSVRTFLEDGDTVIFTGRARRDGVSIGFGVCEGEVLSAPVRDGW
ncbi:MAG: fumarylacetoacetase [Siculibacillus sp.]|nr:fumarylacetoacetase [Siculibacillus sp.]